MRKYRTSQKVWAVVLTLVMVLGMVPPMTVTAVGADAVTRVADPSTLNEYQELFLTPDAIGVELTTENAGGIWTDKSVFSAGAVPAELTGATSEENTTISVTDTGDNFLVALSAIASNKEIVGYSTRPTDTMLVLDLSGSMEGSTSAMVTAANKAIGDLLALNEHNRVGVVLYSGNNSFGDSTTGTATVLLPLGRYTTTSYTGTGSNRVPRYIQSNNEQVSVSNGVSPRTNLGSSKNTSGGTYTQNGIYQAMKQMVNADEKVIPEGSLQAGTTRLPIMVLMTDGEPTAATKDYTNIGTSDVGNGSTGTNAAHDMAFLTQLTMAYAKREIDTAYKTESLVYTLGYSVDNNNYARSVMDPQQYTTNRIDTLWTTFNNTAAGGEFKINDRNGSEDVTKHTDEAGKYTKELKDYRYYTDEYFPASQQSELTAAFQSIVNEIVLQSKYYPTYVENDHDHDGYVTFTDKIGPYMEVTKVHGIVIGDTLFSGALLARGFTDGSIFGTLENPSDLGDNLVWSVQERLGISDVSIARQLLQNAYNYGQLSYTSDTQFSNYIGWYSDANGNYLDFWHEGITTAAPTGATHIIKSYGMLGQTDPAHGISAEDMMYASIRVSQELDDYDGDGISGETMVTWRIPASLIPTITYEVTVDVNSSGVITGVENLQLENANVKPIRLLYEVALQEDIHEWNITGQVSDAYRDSTDNKDAGYVFYSNQWKKENGTTDTTRNTYSHFEPSVQNEWYYYTEDAIIYTDENGTAYTGSAAPSTSGTYYRAYVVYEALETGAYRMHTHYEQISSESLAAATKSGSNWVIPKGTVFRFWDPFNDGKTENTTATHADALHPMIVHSDADDHYYSYYVLGNNGKLSVTPATGIKVTKTVDEAVSGASDTFTFVISGGSGTATLIRLEADGNEASRSALTFADGKAEFTIAADETVYIIGLADGVTYTVSEKGNEHYSVSAVTVNGAAVTGTAAQITANAQTIQSAAFVNSPKGYGDLFITKEIVSDHTVPTDIQNQSFAVTVNVGTALAGQTFTVNATDMADGGVITTAETVAADGTISLTIVHGQTYQIVDLPEGTQVTVTEALTDAQKVYFTGTVKTRDHTGAEQDADNLVTIYKDANSTAVLTNTYAPASGDLTIDFVGTKNFDAEKMTEDAEFTFRLQQYIGSAWVDVDTASVTIPAGTKDASKGFNFDTLELTFTEAGTYSCQILEDIGANTDVTYDRSVYTFTVVVTDNGGQLEAKVVANVESGDEGNFSVTQGTDGDWTVSTVFNNEYHTTATDIDIKKTVVDNAGSGKTSQGFVMESYNASVDADGVWTEGSLIRSAVTDAEGEARLVRNYDNSDFAEGENTKTYHFIIKEKNTGVAGWTYDATHYLVTVVLTRTVDAGGIESIAADFTIHKGVAGENHTFTAGEEVVTSGNAATISFTNTYDPKDAEVDLDIVPTVVKHLEGRTLKAGEFTFAVFENGKASHTSTEGALAVGTNDAEGNVNFDKVLSFSQVGTYHYDVVEITGSLGGVSYDTTIYDMVVEVKDVNGELEAVYYFEDAVADQVTFSNDYEAAGTSLVIDGTKTLTGRPLVNAEFQFTLTEIVSATDTTAKAGGVSLIAESDPDNDDDGTTQFKFPAIDYSEAGTHYYLIEEVNGGTTQNGVTYTTAKFVVQVTVTDPGNGQLAATSEVLDGDSVAFTNTYVPQSTSANLSSTKTLTGRVMIDGEFEFTLTETGSDYTTAKGYTETVKNDTNGDITFSTLHFDKAGDYYYVIEETKGSAGGVTYDETKYHVHISVVDNHQGKLVATTQITRITVENGQQVETSVGGISFYNEYSISDSDELVLEGTKKLVNHTLEAGEFSFGLFDSEGNPLETVQNDDEGKFTFPALKYDETDVGKTYTYLVEEILPVVDGTELTVYKGITYDTTVYTVEVTVSDNGEGGITVAYTVDGNAAGELVFENTYSVTGNDTVELSGTKTLTGDRTSVTADEFTFGLFEGTTKKAEAKVKADGTFQFPALTYTAADVGRTFTYTVKELLPVVDGAEKTVYQGITYDLAVYTVVVTVVDNGAGGVDASYTINGSGHTHIAFKNTYAAAPVEQPLKATKIYEKGLKGGDFTFTLEGEIDGVSVYQEKKNAQNGDIIFDNLKFTKEGTYTFTVTEVDKVLGFIDYSKEVYTVAITVTDNKLGQLEITKVEILNSTGTDSDTIVFENVYVLDDEAKLTIFASKTLTGRNMTAGEFSFGLYDSNGKLIEKVTNAADGSFHFKALEFDETDLGTHTYTVKEILPEVDGVVQKTYEGVTYDTTVYTVQVTVFDNGKGGIEVIHSVNAVDKAPITFANKYEVAPAEVNLKGNKTYDKGLVGDDFTFILEGEIDGTKVKQEKKNDQYGVITFDALKFTKTGTYEFTVKELDEALGFIEYSKEVYEVEVTVTDNGKGALVAAVTVNDKSDGSITFDNVYKYIDAEDEVTITGSKILTGFRTKVQEKEFSFGLYEGATEIEVVDVKADGTFAFSTLTYGKDDVGKHTYTVKEIIPEGAVGGVYEGRTYDDTVYTVTVDVVDDNKGNIVATAAITGAEAITFTNKYEVEAAKVKLEGSKTYDKPLAGDDFTFILEGEIDGTKIKQTKKNAADGSITFDELTFTKEGTYSFTVKEQEEALGFIQYSKVVHEVEITVTDNGKGKLVAAVTVNDLSEGEISFVNVYQFIDADDEVTISGTKKLTGFRTQLKENEFSFGLYKGTEEVEVVKAKADGTFTFKTLTFDQDDIGQHTYTVKEILPTDAEGKALTTQNGYTYDPTEYTVVVTVVDNNEGYIKASYTVDGQAGKAITFANKYEVEAAKVKLAGTKTYDKALVGDDFTFILEGEIDGTKIKQTKKNAADGSITFDELTFTKEGTYTFTVKEQEEALGFIQYSKVVHEVKIVVADNGKGKLVAAVTINDKSDGAITFANDYTLLDADNELTLTGTKTLTGRDLTAGEFTFGLYDASGKLIETVTNDASGAFHFTTLSYTIQEGQSQQYTYTVKEVAGSDPSITYDQTVYTVKVTVADDGKGGAALSYTINDAADGKLAFANTYTPPADVVAKIYIQKTVINKTEPGVALKDFIFVLSNGTNELEVKSDEAGKAGFQITFSADDIGNTYEFKVSEKKGSTAGMTYDTTVHTVTVKVGQNADGSLALTINGQQTNAIELGFTNTYEKPATPVTGDSFPVFLVSMVMLLSAAAAVLLLGKRRKSGKYSA